MKKSPKHFARTFLLFVLSPKMTKIVREITAHVLISRENFECFQQQCLRWYCQTKEKKLVRNCAVFPQFSFFARFCLQLRNIDGDIEKNYSILVKHNSHEIFQFLLVFSLILRYIFKIGFLSAA